METFVSNVIAIVTAFAALLAVILSSISNKKQIASQTITINRIDWIKQVRPILSDFASEYIKGENKNLDHMILLKTQIEFYMRRGEKSYDDLIFQMKKCCEQDYTEKDYTLLILYSQYVLNRAWRRLVLEGKGKLLLSENRINKIVDKETNKLQKQIEIIKDGEL